MDFVTNDITISIERDYYCFLPAEDRRSPNGNRAEILKIYWFYTKADGEWGSISEAYVFVDDVRQMNKKLKQFEYGVMDSLDVELYGENEKLPFICLHVKRSEGLYPVDLKVHDEIFDEYISVCCELTEDEWKSCSDELMSWGKKYSLHLGDRVATLIHSDDTFYLGRIGEITMLYPEDEKLPAQVAVSFTDIGWDNKPCQDTRRYHFDEVKKISEAQEG